MTTAVVALDVGGTTLKGAVVDRSGAALTTVRAPTPRADGAAAVVEAVVATAARLRDEAERLTGAPPVAAGVASLGLVDDAAGVARFSTTIGWRDVPLRDRVAERLGVPVWLTHDVRAGAEAEAALGAGRGHPDFLFVAIGTGIGGAVVRDGRPDPGAHGFAGELGHVVVRPGGPRCGCGGRGCLEAVASGAAIAAAHRAAGGDDVDAAEVVRRAGAGDRTAAAVWAEAVDALADGLLTAITLLDPPLVVLGGGVALAGAALLEPLARALAARATFQAVPPLACAELGDQAACLGAALGAWRALSRPR